MPNFSFDNITDDESLTNADDKIPYSPGIGAGLLLIFCIATAGNGLALLSFCICKQLRKQKGNYLVACLALADFMTAVYTVLPFAIFLLNPNPGSRNSIVCKIHSVVGWMLVTISNMSLAAISVDRALAVSKPFRYPVIVTTFRIKLVILFIWTHGVLLGFLPAISSWMSYQYWEMICKSHWPNSNITIVVLVAVFSFVLPSAILLISNIIIVYTVKRSRVTVFQSCSITLGEGKEKFQVCVKNYTRTLKSLYIIVIVYFCSTPPYYLVKLSAILFAKQIESPVTFTYCVLAMFTASALNPFIYGILRKDHREAFTITLQMISKKFKSVCSFPAK